MRRWFWFLIAASLLAGAVLRLGWMADMEYKYDEQFMFAASQNSGVTEPWPWVGMKSGVSLRNPGLSIWVFIFLARAFSITDPVGLSLAVAAMNVAALVLLLAFILRIVAPDEREPWLWGLTLAAVNPIAIILQRKIWAQSVLPFFCVIFLAGWMKRRTRWGAFLWGLLGACLGQIHMSGFFFSAGFFLWALFLDRKKEPIQWMSWLVGSVIGSLGLIPWIHYLLTHRDPVLPPLHWNEVLEFRFYWQWLMAPFGFKVGYSLGPEAFREYLREPLIHGTATYGMAFVHGIAFAAGGWILWSGFRELPKRLRSDWKGVLSGKSSETAFAQNAAAFAYGGLLTAARVHVFRYYLLITFPLQYVWAARLALKDSRWGRHALVVLWVMQLLMSAAFLQYVHTHGGAPSGEYGASYRTQLPN